VQHQSCLAYLPAHLKAAGFTDVDFRVFHTANGDEQLHNDVTEGSWKAVGQHCKGMLKSGRVAALKTEEDVERITKGLRTDIDNGAKLWFNFNWVWGSKPVSQST
jgi:hypothetical protein